MLIVIGKLCILNGIYSYLKHFRMSSFGVVVKASDYGSRGKRFESIQEKVFSKIKHD